MRVYDWLEEIPEDIETHQYEYRDRFPDRPRLLNIYIKMLGVPMIGRKFSGCITNYFGGTKKAAISPGFKCLYGNIVVGKNVALNDSYCVDYAPIILEDNVKISFRNMFITSKHDYKDFGHILAQPIVLEQNVWVASGCIILGGVRIGANTVIASGSVVTKSIPSNVLAGGNPAKIIKKIDRKI